MTFVPSPLCLHEETVRRDWLDYNDHMNVAYYVMAFDHASEAFADYVGMGPDYARRHCCSWVVVEYWVSSQQS